MNVSPAPAVFAGAATEAGTMHLEAIKLFQSMPAGTVPAAFMSFQEAEQFCMKLPLGVATVVAGAMVFAFAGVAAGAAAVASVALASAAHWLFIKSVHFIAPSGVPAAFAALNLVEQTFMKLSLACTSVPSIGAAATIKAKAKDILRSVLDIEKFL